MTSLDDLPGRDLIEQGLEDVLARRVTVESLLVTIARPRLESLGLEDARLANFVRDPELALYALLGQSGVPDPYSRYNALLRELASFVHALEHRVWRGKRAGTGADPSGRD